jgi:hypothetical protein
MFPRKNAASTAKNRKNETNNKLLPLSKWHTKESRSHYCNGFSLSCTLALWL